MTSERLSQHLLPQARMIDVSSRHSLEGAVVLSPQAQLPHDMALDQITYLYSIARALVCKLVRGSMFHLKFLIVGTGKILPLRGTHAHPSPRDSYVRS